MTSNISARPGAKEHELSALGARERTAGDSHRRGFEKLTAERDALKQQLAQSAQRRRGITLIPWNQGIKLRRCVVLEISPATTQ